MRDISSKGEYVIRSSNLTTPLWEQSPFWWIPLWRWPRCGDEPLLYSRAARCFDFWVSRARILIDLAEEILAINELKGAPPKRPKRQASTFELPGCGLRDNSDYVFLAQSGGVTERLA